MQGQIHSRDQLTRMPAHTGTAMIITETKIAIVKEAITNGGIRTTLTTGQTEIHKAMGRAMGITGDSGHADFGM